ncbi:MAG: gamma-glutamyl-gamma-aminobutyrate hydrolase family protein [Clostridia bacterium]|nr:gamma-glutamyl-gamma-aminobutyrate hydrolase family protein [Clostridia bacterium]
MTKAKEQNLRIAIPLLPGMTCENYLNALTNLHAEGVLVRETPDVSAFDGLLLPGGVDVDPSTYHAENIASVDTNVELDVLQKRVADAFIGAGKPVLGICRGNQMLNVCLGGTLIQHLPSSLRHSRDAGSAFDKVHMNRATPGSWIARLYGETFATNSSHHQAVDKVGAHLIVDMYSDDGVVEAIHHETLPLYGVQWHPERMCFAHKRDDTVDGSIVIGFFLDECRRLR